MCSCLCLYLYNIQHFDGSIVLLSWCSTQKVEACKLSKLTATGSPTTPALHTLLCDSKNATE